MKILVVSYSRTGTTARLGEKIAQKLVAKTDAVIDETDRNGIRGWLGGGKDALFEKPTVVKFEKDPKEYDLVIIGTPVWVGTMTPAIRKYILENEFAKVAFFATFAGNISKTFKEMEKLCKKPIAVLGVKDKDLESELAFEQIEEFCAVVNEIKF
jgi:flavodoxin